VHNLNVWTFLAYQISQIFDSVIHVPIVKKLQN